MDNEKRREVIAPFFCPPGRRKLSFSTASTLKFTGLARLAATGPVE
jgi:hypothetical protein